MHQLSPLFVGISFQELNFFSRFSYNVDILINQVKPSFGSPRKQCCSFSHLKASVLCSFGSGGENEAENVFCYIKAEEKEKTAQKKKKQLEAQLPPTVQSGQFSMAFLQHFNCRFSEGNLN